MEKIGTYVLDSCALVAFFQSEVGGEKLREIFKNRSNNVLMHAINLGEVYYDTLRRSQQNADELLEYVFKLPINLIWDIDEQLIKTAGHFKVNYKMSYADSFVLATAHIHKGSVVSTDHHEFDTVEQNTNLEFFWLR